jgi:hypothetical protein
MNTHTILRKTLRLAATETTSYRFQRWKNWGMGQPASEVSQIENPLKTNKPLCFSQPLELGLHKPKIIIKPAETFQHYPNKQLQVIKRESGRTDWLYIQIRVYQRSPHNKQAQPFGYLNFN